MKRELKRETRLKRQMQRERACTAASRFNRRVRTTAIARMPVGCSRSAREVRHSSVARLDTGWHAHPKLLGLGLAAMGLHAWSISYCDAVRSDGFIPSGAWPSLPGVKAAVAKLHAAGLWEAGDDRRITGWPLTCPNTLSSTIHSTYY